MAFERNRTQGKLGAFLIPWQCSKEDSIACLEIGVNYSEECQAFVDHVRNHIWHSNDVRMHFSLNYSAKAYPNQVSFAPENPTESIHPNIETLLFFRAKHHAASKSQLFFKTENA